MSDINLYVADKEQFSIVSKSYFHYQIYEASLINLIRNHDTSALDTLMQSSDKAYVSIICECDESALLAINCFAYDMSILRDKRFHRRVKLIDARRVIESVKHIRSSYKRSE